MAKCKGCNAEILWIKTMAGKPMPLNIPKITVTKSTHGEILILENGVVQRNPPAGTTGYMPHWATCPQAKKFKGGES